MKLVAAMALLLMMAEPAGAEGKLKVVVTPNVAFAPATLIVRAMIEADPANRAIVIVAESSDFYRSSEIPLDGDRAPRVTWIEVKSVPAGTYVVTGALLDSNRHVRMSSASQLSVLSGVGGGR
jgi:hypothetical protein